MLRSGFNGAVTSLNFDPVARVFSASFVIAQIFGEFRAGIPFHFALEGSAASTDAHGPPGLGRLGRQARKDTPNEVVDRGRPARATWATTSLSGSARVLTPKEEPFALRYVFCYNSSN